MVLAARSGLPSEKRRPAAGRLLAPPVLAPHMGCNEENINRMQHFRILAVGSIVCGGIGLGRTSVALRHIGSTLVALRHILGSTSVALREHLRRIR